MHDFNNRRKAGVALFAQGLVKPFAGDACVLGQSHHSARPGDVTYRFGERGVVFWAAVYAGLQVLRAVFVRLQAVGGFTGSDA